MKAISVLKFVLILTCLFFLGCPSDPSSPTIINNSSGGVKFSFDKTNTPASVSVITVTMSRNGFNPIIANLNLMSDTSATVAIDNIPVGTWALKVEAMNDSNVVLYRGETNVTISVGQVAQINLTLVPTNQNVGSIQIFVTWGTQPTLWIDYYLNPIMTPNYYYWDFAGLFHPKVIKDGNLFKMWYVGLADASLSHTGYAYSTDGISWTRTSTPVLKPGDSLAWDSRAAQVGAVIKEDGLYRMYYNGWKSPYEAWHIGLAQSVDGINWTKQSNPILTASSTENQIIVSSILKVNNTFYLYYTSRNYPVYKINLAISNNGINFTKYSGNPILTATQNWEGTGVNQPSVIKDGNSYMMVYGSASEKGFGLAYSSDGKVWTKSSTNPFFNYNNTVNNWASASVAYPNLIKLENEFRVYYSGANSISGTYKLGFVKR